MVSTPPARPASIWPSAILLPMQIAASRLVPQARCTSSAGRLRIAARSDEHALADQVVVLGMLDDRARDDVAQPLALELVTLHHAAEGGGEHVLVADPGVRAVRAREWNAKAADDGDPPDCGPDEHRASPTIWSARPKRPQGCHAGESQR